MSANSSPPESNPYNPPGEPDREDVLPSAKPHLIVDGRWVIAFLVLPLVLALALLLSYWIPKLAGFF